MTGSTQRSLHWDGDAVVAVDQCALPHEYRLLTLRTPDEVIDAIKRLAIRGAPAIGVAGALAVALSARAHTVDGRCDEIAVRTEAARISDARPTAVNLSWAVRRVLGTLSGGADAVLTEALAMLAEDEQRNRAAAGLAADLVRGLCGHHPLRLLTHCNTGRLATVAWGTALGAIRELAEDGCVAEVLFGETRPLLQGARLTAWELAEAGIPHRMCVDSAGPAALAAGMIDCVLVGADRVCANGDVANKIGTYSLALAAHRAGVPFVVVAPVSTLDLTLATGADIVIEERAAGEVTGFGGVRVAPAGTGAFNPAFDVTPADLITAVVTEDGVYRPAEQILKEAS
jgi:S-methyl-5-thioribose-1-phosphate isomerase